MDSSQNELSWSLRFLTITIFIHDEIGSPVVLHKGFSVIYILIIVYAIIREYQEYTQIYC